MERDRPRFRGLWWKLPLAGLALLVLLTFVAHTIWTSRERAGMLREVAKIRALGEPIDVADLTEPTLPDAQNRAVAIRAAIAAYVEPDERKDLRQQIESDDPNAFELPLTETEIALLREHVADNAEALRLLEGLDLKPGTAWLRPSAAGALRLFALRTELGRTRDLASTLADAVRLAANDGETLACFARLRDVEALASPSAANEDLIGLLVSFGIRNIAASATIEVAPTLHVKPEDRRAVERWIAALLDDAEIARQHRAALVGERASIHEAFDALATARLTLATLTGGTKPSNSLGEHVVGYAIRPLVYAGDANALAYFAALLASVDKPDLIAWRRSAMTPQSTQAAANASGFRNLIGSILTPSLNRIFETRYRLLTDRHLAAAALAVRLHAIDHDGALPSSLEALVPVYLPRVPADAIDGQPLRYDPARAILWSVGADGSDDGGDETLERPELGRDRWRMRDAVVNLTPQPRPATQPSE